MEDPVTTEYISRHIAAIQQRYTQSGGTRPFGVSTLITGFDKDSEGHWQPRLFQTDPSGVYSAWKANAIGRSAKTVREFLEKNYPGLPKDGATTDASASPSTQEITQDEAVKLAVRALLEVVQTGAKNIEVAILSCPNPTAKPGQHVQIRNLTQEEIERWVKVIEQEKEAEAEAKKRQAQSVAAAQTTGVL